MYRKGTLLWGLPQSPSGERNAYRITSPRCIVRVISESSSGLEVEVVKSGIAVPQGESVGQVFIVESRFFTMYAVNKGEENING